MFWLVSYPTWKQPMFSTIDYFNYKGCVSCNKSLASLTKFTDFFSSTVASGMELGVGRINRRTMWKMGKEDLRRVIHALKVRLPLTLVSLLYLMESLFEDIDWPECHLGCHDCDWNARATVHCRYIICVCLYISIYISIYIFTEQCQNQRTQKWKWAIKKDEQWKFYTRKRKDRWKKNLGYGCQ